MISRYIGSDDQCDRMQLRFEASAMERSGFKSLQQLSCRPDLGYLPAAKPSSFSISDSGTSTPESAARARNS